MGACIGALFEEDTSSFGGDADGQSVLEGLKSSQEPLDATRVVRLRQWGPGDILEADMCYNSSGHQNSSEVLSRGHLTGNCSSYHWSPLQRLGRKLIPAVASGTQVSLVLGSGVSVRRKWEMFRWQPHSLPALPQLLLLRERAGDMASCKRK